jgi:outer membrane cobalamin receptor
VTASAGYTLLDSRVVTNLSTSQQFQPGQPLLRRPRHSGTVRAAWALGPALVFASLRLVGVRHDNSFLSLRTVPTPERPLPVTTDITVNPGYAVVGMGTEWRLRHSSLFVRGDNMTDTRYADVLGYPGLPRSLTVGARMDLGLGR